MTALTDRQAEVLEAVRRLTAEKGWPPTLRELSDYLGIRTTAVRDHLVLIEKKGHIVRSPNSARGLRIVEAAG